MAIATLDALLAGVQPPRLFAKGPFSSTVAGRVCSTWGMGGIPGPGSYDGTLNGATLSSTSSLPAGAMPRIDGQGGSNSYLARLQGQLNVNLAGTVLLIDRLWHNGGYTITATSAQTSTTPTWPARDNNGATSGDGVLIGLEVSATIGAGTPTLTLSYTNQAGTSGRTSTNVMGTATTPVAGSFWMFGLQGADTGVQSVQSLTLSATWSSGTINLVAFRILAAMEIPGTNSANAIDAVTGGMPRIYDGSVLQFLVMPSTGAVLNLTGSYVESQG